MSTDRRSGRADPKVALGIVLLALLSISLHAGAGVYTWVDEHGVRQFSDKPPAAAGARVQSIEVPQIGTVVTRQLPADALPPRSAGKKAARSRRVVMYSAPWCGVCKRAAGYFRDKGIAFHEKDIDQSRQARREFEQLGGRGVPLILVGKRKLAGFSPASFEQLYSR